MPDENAIATILCCVCSAPMPVVLAMPAPEDGMSVIEFKVQRMQTIAGAPLTLSEDQRTCDACLAKAQPLHPEIPGAPPQSSPQPSLGTPPRS